jgi:hypothetical protein
VRIARRKVELREAVRRVIFTETEGEQQDYLWELLDDRLDEVLPDDWGLEPLDDHVTWLCAELDLPLEAAARWRELPDIVYGDQASPAGASPAQAAAPPPGRPPAAPEWRSSA